MEHIDVTVQYRFRVQFGLIFLTLLERRFYGYRSSVNLIVIFLYKINAEKTNYCNALDANQESNVLLKK